VNLQDTNNNTLAGSGHGTKHEPLAISRSTIVDDLDRVVADASTIKHLGGSVVTFDGPVVDGLVGDEGNGLLIQPSPEHDVVHGSLLENRLEFNTEDLEAVLDCKETKRE
jgi:hypothetical protein